MKSVDDITITYQVLFFFPEYGRNLNFEKPIQYEFKQNSKEQNWETHWSKCFLGFLYINVTFTDLYYTHFVHTSCMVVEKICAANFLML